MIGVFILSSDRYHYIEQPYCFLLVGGEKMTQRREYKYHGILSMRPAENGALVDPCITALMWAGLLLNRGSKAETDLFSNLHCGHEILVLSKTAGLQIKVAKMSFLHRVTWLSLSKRVRN